MWTTVGQARKRFRGRSALQDPVTFRSLRTPQRGYTAWTNRRLHQWRFEDRRNNQCFSRVRNGIAEKKGRTAEQQHAWEQELREEIKPQARKLFRSAVEAVDNRDVRAPKGIAAAPASLETQLHEPLIPLQR